MNRLAYAICLLVIFLWPGLLGAARQSTAIILDGKRVKVYWNDGDSFRILGKWERRSRARLKGYNTLENYGPVHRWGKWKAWQLYLVGNRATQLARTKIWKCSTLPGSGGYGRRLVSCPGLARALIGRGLAHVFSMRGPGQSALLRRQRLAQKNKRGIWAKGVPQYIITSLHTAKYGRMAYNRLIHTGTGASKKMWHKRRHKVCSWICAGGSCMLWVPYRVRYGRWRPYCLRLK